NRWFCRPSFFCDDHYREIAKQRNELNAKKKGAAEAPQGSHAKGQEWSGEHYNGCVEWTRLRGPKPILPPRVGNTPLNETPDSPSEQRCRDGRNARGGEARNRARDLALLTRSLDGRKC